MLRPYNGTLIEGNFHEVIQCLKILSSEVQTGEMIDRRVTSDIMSIVYYSRLWALDPGGMLRRNNLITENDQVRVEEWINIIDYTFLMTIDSCDLDEAFHEYNRYCLERSSNEK